MHRATNSNWAGLSAGTIGLYVTESLFTTDVCMLRLRNMSRLDFKPLLFLLILCENNLHLSTFTLRQPFFAYASFLNPRQTRV